jgi:mRNA interferase HigB
MSVAFFPTPATLPKLPTVIDCRYNSETFPHADQVTVASKRTVTVFNIGGNNYRLITAIHYNTKIVYILRFLTHAEYDKDAWKKAL